jgi:hypothetical protein
MEIFNCLSDIISIAWEVFTKLFISIVTCIDKFTLLDWLTVIVAVYLVSEINSKTGYK